MIKLLTCKYLTFYVRNCKISIYDIPSTPKDTHGFVPAHSHWLLRYKQTTVHPVRQPVCALPHHKCAGQNALTFRRDICGNFETDERAAHTGRMQGEDNDESAANSRLKWGRG